MDTISFELCRFWTSILPDVFVCNQIKKILLQGYYRWLALFELGFFMGGVGIPYTRYDWNSPLVFISINFPVSKLMSI